jgi:hypothetical protein
MDRFLYPGFKFGLRKPGQHLLAAAWLLGLSAGIFVAIHASTSFFLLMRSAIFCKVSIVCLLLSGSLPFLLSAYAFSFNQDWLVIPVCFLKAFLFSSVACGLLLSYHIIGWFLVIYLLFCDICTFPPLWLFWLNHFNQHKPVSILDVLCVCGVHIFVVAVYSCWISPFASNHIFY